VRSTAVTPRRERLGRARLYLVAGSASGGPGWWTAVERALASGVIDVLQLRDAELDDAAFVAQARAARRLCDVHGALLIVNDRVSLAAACEADGAHVGEHDLPAGLARLLLGEERLLGLSTHDAAEVAAAHGQGVDYVGLGPCFPSETKSLRRSPGGPALVAAAQGTARTLPLFPIGGITPENAASLVAAGARRLAVGGAVLRAADPAAVALRLAGLLPAAP
jgi:thiamine-phosphate pyrophosphorylase